MLISAVLRILGTPEAPRRVSAADTEKQFPKITRADVIPEAPLDSLHEAEHQALAEVNIVRPLAPDPSVLFSPGANPDYGNYLRALQKQASPGKSHAVDVFE